jgi:hypothetical protein
MSTATPMECMVRALTGMDVPIDAIETCDDASLSFGERMRRVRAARCKEAAILGGGVRDAVFNNRAHPMLRFAQPIAECVKETRVNCCASLPMLNGAPRLNVVATTSSSPRVRFDYFDATHDALPSSVAIWAYVCLMMDFAAPLCAQTARRIPWVSLGTTPPGDMDLYAAQVVYEHSLASRAASRFTSRAASRMVSTAPSRTASMGAPPASAAAFEAAVEAAAAAGASGSGAAAGASGSGAAAAGADE